jgi:hypothetical protein
MAVQHGNRFVYRLLLDEDHHTMLLRAALLARRRPADYARVVVEEHLEKLESESSQVAS